MEKHSIEVRRYPSGSIWKGGYTVIAKIRRVLRAESIGNFNPLFCRYENNPRVLVHSDEGDVSDPFRRDVTYLKTLFIEAK